MEQIQCTCTKCKNQMQREVLYVYVPQQRDALQKMEYFKAICPKCGHNMKLYYPCVYLNEEKHFIVFFTGGRLFESPALEAERLTKRKSTDMEARICVTLEEFIEKVEIFEAGLDDRSMEMFKLTLFARLHIQDPALQYVYFYRRTNHEQLEFTLVFGQETRGISVSQDLYMGIFDIMEKEAANEVADGFLTIDREWAGQRIKNEIGELSQEDL